METTPSSIRQIWVLMATVFIDMIGFLMVLPLLPFYAVKLGPTASTVGALVSAFAFAQLAISPVWGRLSDRYGRRPMILAGLFASAVAYVVFGLANAIWLLFVSRLVQGAGGGTPGVVQAYIADSFRPEERAKALGWLTAATSAGVMIGPLAGSLATYLGARAPGFVAAGAEARQPRRGLRRRAAADIGPPGALRGAAPPRLAGRLVDLDLRHRHDGLHGDERRAGALPGPRFRRQREDDRLVLRLRRRDLPGDAGVPSGTRRAPVRRGGGDAAGRPVADRRPGPHP